MPTLDVIDWSVDVPESYKTPGDREYIEPSVLMRIGMFYLLGDDPGTILEYCFQGDWKRALFGVVTGGGDITLAGLFSVGMYLTNRLPMACQGDVRKYHAWAEAGGYNGILTITDTHIVPLTGDSIRYTGEDRD